MSHACHKKPDWLLTLTFVFFIAGAAWCADSPPGGKNTNQQVADALKDILNRGATLYNQGDRNGCYRLFEGALLAFKPQFAQDAKLMAIVAKGLREAEAHQGVGERAFALRTALVDVRNQLALDGVKAAEAPDAKPQTSAGATVSGLVVFDDGQPLPGAFIRFTSEEGPGKGYTDKTTDDGSFVIREVKPGKYRVSFATTDAKVVIPEAYRLSGTTPVVADVKSAEKWEFKFALRRGKTGDEKK